MAYLQRPYVAISSLDVALTSQLNNAGSLTEVSWAWQISSDNNTWSDIGTGILNGGMHYLATPTPSSGIRYYRASAVVSNGTTSYTIYSDHVAVEKMATPFGFAATPGANKITLTWDSVADTTYYIGKRLGDGIWDFEPFEITGGTYEVSSLVDNAIYSFQIIAFNKTVVPQDFDINTYRYIVSEPVTINNIMFSSNAICFLADSPVLTPTGYRPISSIKEGELVRTAAGLDVVVKRVFAKEYQAGRSVNPFVIPKGSFGALRALPISPNHEVMVSGCGMVKAKDLGLPQMKMAGSFTYYNLELEDWVRDNLVVAGVECESLAPAKRITMTKAEFARFVKARYGPAAAARLRTVCFEEKDGSVSMPAFV